MTSRRSLEECYLTTWSLRNDATSRWLRTDDVRLFIFSFAWIIPSYRANCHAYSSLPSCKLPQRGPGRSRGRESNFDSFLSPVNVCGSNGFASFREGRMSIRAKNAVFWTSGIAYIVVDRTFAAGVNSVIKCSFIVKVWGAEVFGFNSLRDGRPCGWGFKAGMVCVWVAGKTVWSPCYTRTISERAL